MMSSLASEKVLVVDDEEFTLHSTIQQLKQFIKNKSCLDFCYSGKEAIDLVKLAHASGESYKIIILDFNMPNMSGIETAAAIREYLGE